MAGGYPFPGFSVTVPPFPPDQDLAQAHRDTRLNLTLLGLLNARFLAAEFPMDYEDLTLLKVMGRTHVYVNERALPRAFVVGQVKVISDEEKILSELALFDPKKLAILEEKPGWTLDDPSLFQEAENYLLRSVYLEEGRHTIEFVYDPLSFKVGRWVSAGAVLGLVAYVVSVIRRQRE
jgi:hypothetical protein